VQGNLHARFLEGESSRGPTYLNPALIGGFGNFLLPLLVGGPDMAKLKNLPSRYIGRSLNSYILNTFRRYSTNSDSTLKDKYLGSYLAGLFEGDGHISISKPGTKGNNLSLSITFHLKDLPFAKSLKEITGFG